MAVTSIKVAWSHAYELRKVLIERTETVIDPCADCRYARIQHMSAGMKLDLGPVIVICGPH